METRNKTLWDPLKKRKSDEDYEPSAAEDDASRRIDLLALSRARAGVQTYDAYVEKQKALAAIDPTQPALPLPDGGEIPNFLLEIFLSYN